MRIIAFQKCYINVYIIYFMQSLPEIFINTTPKHNPPPPPGDWMVAPLPQGPVGL